MSIRSRFLPEKDFPLYLSSDQMACGRKLIWRFFTFNGISVAFLMENILILYALRNGVSEPLVAVLASFVHLTMPFMIFGKRFAARYGGARTWFIGWFLRYVSVSFLILAPWVARYGDQRIVSGIILASGFAFAMFRSFGAVATTPIEGEVTTAENRGQFLSGNFLRVNTAQIIATTLLILITSIVDDLWVYQIVIAAACVTGLYSSTLLARVPESKATRESAKIPLGKALKTLWINRRTRILLFSWSAGIISFMMVNPFMMIAVKSGYGVSDYTALTFSLVLVFGGIISSLINGIMSDQVGPRPIVLMHTAGMLIPAGFFALAPEQFYPAAVGAAFFIGGYCKMGVLLGLGHYFLSAVDEYQRVGTILYIRILSGTAAGLSGSVIGGGLLSALSSLGFTGMDIYRNYFRTAAAAVIVMIIIVRSLDKLHEWPIKNILRLLVSPRDFYAIYVLRRLQSSRGGRYDTREVQRLGAIRSPVSEDELRNQLESPLLSVRVQALRALGRMPFGKKSEDAVIQQLKTGEHTSAWVAAEILGEHRVSRAVELLRQGLSSTDRYLQGKCMVSLVRLGDTSSYRVIASILSESKNPRIVIHGAVALGLTKDPAYLPLLLKKSLDDSLPESVRDEVLVSAASAADARNRFYRFLRQYHRNRSTGISQLISDLDAPHIGPDDISVLSGEHPPKLFMKLLHERSSSSDAPLAAAVQQVLQETEETQLPIKTVFCMALILTSSRQKVLVPAGTAE